MYTEGQIKEMEELLTIKKQEVKDLEKKISDAYSENYKDKMYRGRNKRRAARSTI